MYARTPLPRRCSFLRALAKEPASLLEGKAWFLLSISGSTPQLIDIGGIAELRGIAVTASGMRIGAGTRHADLQRSGLVAQHAPLIAEAVPHIAHAAIRNRGTIGGNLAHADPASELPACLVALDATIIATGPEGERSIAAAEFFTGIHSTALKPDEI